MRALEVSSGIPGPQAAREATVDNLAERIAIGVAGWSYPDWDGWVYPPGVRDRLAYVASYFDLVEINSTFYRPPGARNAESWRRRTEGFPDFFFTAKIHQDVTHGGKIEPATVRAFRDGLAPLREAGKLRHLLAQFRYDFADAPQTRAHLLAIRDSFGDVANLTLELRHGSWQAPGALDYLRSLGVTVAALDYPEARDSFRMRRTGIGEHAYLRLHGRNYKAWFSRESGRDETYNYLYAGRELEELRDRILETARMSASLTVVANNHYQGKEAVNALQLKAMVTGCKVRVPPPLAEKYPELRAIAQNGE